MEKANIKQFIAARAAQELNDGDVLNLGIGLPTLVPQYLKPGVDVTIHAELGIVGAGGVPNPESDCSTIPITLQTLAVLPLPYQKAEVI